MLLKSLLPLCSVLRCNFVSLVAVGQKPRVTKSQERHLMTIVRTLFSAAAIMAAVGAQLNSAIAATTYTTSFEDFTLGPLSSGGTAQNGWSGGAQPDLTNNDAGDEQIVNTQAHTGAQSWHYARGYNSPGQGTAFTPSLSPSVANVGDTMIGSLWFKAHTLADNSSFAIETGNPAGDDRAEIVAYVENLAGGLTIRSFTGAAFDGVPIASGLDASVWHQLSFSLALTSTDNALSVSVDGGAPVLFDGSLKDFRDANLFSYSESSRLKLRPRHADGDLSFNGFYLDDISYSITAVPEPGSFVLLATMGTGLIVARRRRRA
jgi:hypothetical protein